MKEARELQTLIDELGRYIVNQDNEIERLQTKIHGALSALQTGHSMDVVVAIEILRDKNET